MRTLGLYFVVWFFSFIHSFIHSFFLSFSFCLSIYLFSSPILSRRRLNVYHTSTRCGLRANLKCWSEMYCTRLAENTGRNKSPFWYHWSTLSGCIFAAQACIDNWKKNLLNTDASSTCPHNMVNFGLLMAEICW